MACRIVVDTNLMVAGRWNPKSASNRIIDLVLEGRVGAAYSPQIKDENLYILLKVKPNKKYLDRILKFYQASKLVRPKTKVRVCEDKADDKYLEAALAADADYVVSSDHHLLDVGRYKGVEVLKPGEFTRRLGKEERPKRR